MIKKYLTDEALVIVDESDIAKPYAEKMEALGYVHDGSRNKIEKGYPTVNFSIATTKTNHPIPIYHSVCSAKAERFESMNVEVAKALIMWIVYLRKSSIHSSWIVGMIAIKYTNTFRIKVTNSLHG